MTSRDFCYWLQGYFELANPNGIENNKLEAIKNHLNMVFKHEIDPSMGPKPHQEELSALHQATQSFGVVNQQGMRPNHPNPIFRC